MPLYIFIIHHRYRPPLTDHKNDIEPVSWKRRDVDLIHSSPSAFILGGADEEVILHFVLAGHQEFLIHEMPLRAMVVAVRYDDFAAAGPRQVLSSLATIFKDIAKELFEL